MEKGAERRVCMFVYERMNEFRPKKKERMNEECECVWGFVVSTDGKQKESRDS